MSSGPAGSAGVALGLPWTSPGAASPLAAGRRELPAGGSTAHRSPLHRLPIRRLPIRRLRMHRLRLHRLRMHRLRMHRLRMHRLRMHRLRMHRLRMHGWHRSPALRPGWRPARERKRAAAHGSRPQTRTRSPPSVAFRSPVCDLRSAIHTGRQCGGIWALHPATPPRRSCFALLVADGEQRRHRCRGHDGHLGRRDRPSRSAHRK
jgi:hypothetical protein